MNIKLQDIKCWFFIHDKKILAANIFGANSWHIWEINWDCNNCGEGGTFTTRNSKAYKKYSLLVGK